MAESREAEAWFKVVVVGESGVGKTSLVNRFVDDTYSSSPTIGVDFKVKNLSIRGECGIEYPVKLQLWDTAGQERFKGIVRAYYKGGDGAILVYDSTSEASFVAMKNYWLEEIKQQSPRHVCLVCIGNKSELECEYDWGEESKVTALCKKYGMKWVRASAKEATGVDEAFGDLAKAIVDKYELKQRPGSTKEKANAELDGEGSIKERANVELDGEGSIKEKANAELDGEGSIKERANVELDGEGSVSSGPGDKTKKQESTCCTIA